MVVIMYTEVTGMTSSIPKVKIIPDAITVSCIGSRYIFQSLMDENK
jgi:hypothetical protein